MTLLVWRRRSRLKSIGLNIIFSILPLSPTYDFQHEITKHFQYKPPLKRAPHGREGKHYYFKIMSHICSYYNSTYENNNYKHMPCFYLFAR